VTNSLSLVFFSLWTKQRDNIVHYWHSDQKRKFKCKLTAQTALIRGQQFLTGTSGEHTHEANYITCSSSQSLQQIEKNS
jgi:hypothetical protein